MIDAKMPKPNTSKLNLPIYKRMIYRVWIYSKIQDCCNLRLLIKFDAQVQQNLWQIKNRRESLLANEGYL